MSSPSHPGSPRPYIRQTALCAMALLCVGLMAACGNDQSGVNSPPPTFKFPIDVKMTDSASGDGVAGLPVMIDSKTIGYTDANGVLKAVIEAEHETPITLAVGEAGDWSHMPEQTYEVEQKLSVKYNDDKTALLAKPVTLYGKVATESIDYLIWISADCEGDADEQDCEGLEVLVNNEVVATTDIAGRAHFLHSGSPGDKLKVSINTTLPPEEDDEDPRALSPQQPAYDITLGESSEAYAVKQTFDIAELEGDKPEKKTRRKKRRRRKRSRNRNRNRKKQTKKKPEPSFDLLGSKDKKKDPPKKDPPKKDPPKKKEDPKKETIDLFGN